MSLIVGIGIIYFWFIIIASIITWFQYHAFDQDYSFISFLRIVLFVFISTMLPVIGLVLILI